MRNLLLSLLLFSTGHAETVKDEPGLEEQFKKHGVSGCFVLLDPQADVLHVYNQKRAVTRFQPASTFKIVNALMGIEVKAVKNLDEVIPYGGTKNEFLEIWEQDMNLRDAMKVSNVPVFHQLAKRIGPGRMSAMLTSFRYGNHDIGGDMDVRFWLKGPLNITPIEQVEFLDRLSAGKLRMPEHSGGDKFVKPESTRDLRELIRYEQTPERTIYAKTGWLMNGPDEPQVGWWVGWIERKDGARFPFALNIEIKKEADAKERIPLALECVTVILSGK